MQRGGQRERADLQRVAQRPSEREHSQPCPGHRAQLPRRRAQRQAEQAAGEHDVESFEGEVPRSVSNRYSRDEPDRQERARDQRDREVPCPAAKLPAQRGLPVSRPAGVPPYAQACGHRREVSRNIGATRIVGIINPEDGPLRGLRYAQPIAEGPTRGGGTRAGWGLIGVVSRTAYKPRPSFAISFIVKRASIRL